MATVIVGSLNELSICRIETDAKIQGIDDPKYVEFNIPSKDTAVEPGSPKWANYVKGVVAGFHGRVAYCFFYNVNTDLKSLFLFFIK